MVTKNTRQRVLEAFSPGTVVDGRYRVDSHIGDGKMGVVFRAVEAVVDRPVALKVMSPPTREARDFLATRFIKEAAALGKFRSQHVVSVYAYGVHQGHPYLALEYVGRGTVEDLIERHGALPVDVALGILSQMAAAVDDVHAHGLVHRDVKPANALIGERFEVRLADFGLVQLLEGEHDSDLIAGSPHYIAPEIIKCKVDPALRTAGDIYALGVCAYQMLTGEVPFEEAESLRDLFKRVCTMSPPGASQRRPGLPVGVSAVLAKAMHRDPALRFERGDHLVTALRKELQATKPDRTRVLAVDDDPQMRTIYRVALEAAIERIEVEVAEDGLVALELAKAHRPDVMIIDLAMPNLNGRQLCAVVAQEPGLRACKRVVISGVVTTQVRRELRELGVREIVQKPINPRTLVELVQGLLEAES